MDKPNRKSSSATPPDVNAMASKAAKVLHKAAKACMVDQRKAGQGSTLQCAILSLAAVAAEHHGALAETLGSKAEALLRAPLALAGVTAEAPKVVEAEPAAKPAEVPATSTTTAVQEK